MSDAPNPSVIHARSGTVREIVGFSVPLVISNLSQSMIWVVDTLIMGRVGTAEQGAVGLGGVLCWALSCFFVGTMSAVNILVAQDHGAGRTDTARHARSGLLLSIPLGAVLLAQLPLVPLLLGLLGSSSVIRPLAQSYILIRLAAAPFTVGSMVLVSFLRGLSDTKTPMIVTLIVNIANAVLAWVLALGVAGAPRLGVRGAGIAAAIAAFIEFAGYFAVYVFAKRARAHGSGEWRLPKYAEMRQLLALGTPIGVSWLFEMIAWTAFSVYAGTRPPAELAAHVILFQVTGFCFMPAVALGVAASTLVGQYLGAGRSDLAWITAWKSLGIGVSYMAVLGALIAMGRGVLITSFNADPAVLAVGLTLGLLAGAYQPFDGFGIIAQGVLRGAGRTTIPTMVMLGSGFLVFIPLVWWFGEKAHMGVAGAWTAAVIHVSVVATVLGAVMWKGNWRNAKPVSAAP